MIDDIMQLMDEFVYSLENELFGRLVKRAGEEEIGFITGFYHKRNNFGFKVTYLGDRADQHVEQTSFDEYQILTGPLCTEPKELEESAEVEEVARVRILDAETGHKMWALFGNIGRIGETGNNYCLFHQEQLDILKKLDVEYELVDKRSPSETTE